MDNSKKINYQGEKLFMSDIARKNEINYITLRNKYTLTDGDIDKAVVEAKAVRRGPYEYAFIDFFGKRMPIEQIAKIYGINDHSLKRAYKLTSDIDEAIDLCINHSSVRKYKKEKDTISINKLTNLAYSFDECGLKINNALLNHKNDPIAIVEDEVLNDELKKQIAMLPEREAKVLRLRYGIDDGLERTLDEVGSIMGVSGEYVRRLQDEALRKLRHFNRNKYFNPDYTTPYEKLITRLMNLDIYEKSRF